MTDYDVSAVKHAAAGRWIEILEGAGLPPEILDGRHHPCPRCGGVDRFRLIDPDLGAVYCNQCFDHDNGDGLAAVGWFCGWSFAEALQWLAGRLGVAADSRDIVATVAESKRVRRSSLEAYGAQAAMRGQAPVARLPMYGPDLQQVGHFDIGGGSLSKGLTNKGGSLGLFLPHVQGAPRKPAAGESWLLLEGPKDPAAALELGYLAIGLPGTHPGKKTWQALQQLLGGVKVTIVPDADEASQGLACRLQEQLGPIVAELRQAALPAAEGRTDGFDLRDARRDAGDQATRAAIDSAEVVRNGTPSSNGNGQPLNGFAVRRPVVRMFEDIESRQVDWVWPRFIPNGCLSLLCGKPGYGKSVITCAIAAMMTTGDPWPDHVNTRVPGWAILVPFEDSAEHVIRPRLEAAGADLARVACFEMRGGRINLGQAIDLEYLRDAVNAFRERYGADVPGMIILDPISSAMGGRDANADDEVRTTLELAQQLAVDEQIAIVGIRHLRKASAKAQQGDFIDRVKGAGAFVEVARQILGLGVHPELPDNQMALAVAKSNFGAKRGYNVAFEIIDRGGQPVAQWHGDSEIEIEDLALANSRRGKPSPATDAGESWLVDVLSDAPAKTMARLDVEQLHRVARETNGELPSWRTIERAASKLADDGLLASFREHVAPGRAMWRLF